MKPALAQTQLEEAPMPAANVAPPNSPERPPDPQATSSATPPPGSVRWSLSAHTTYVGTSTNGPGTTPVEAAGFIAGSPLSPLTPYDTFSSAPLFPGNASESAVLTSATWYGRSLQASALIGAGHLTGSVPNAIYWGESPIPALNPHVGSQALPTGLAFPTSAGQDDGMAFRASVVQAAIGTRDGRLRLRGGWFDLDQSDGFVFTQPAIVNAPPTLALVPAESLGDGTPSIDSWSAAPSVYQLHGVDVTAKVGRVSLEASDATLPALPGTAVRTTIASVVIDHGEGTRYSVEALHLWTGGGLVPTTVLFGQGTLIDSPQGELPVAVLGGQEQTIVGARAAVHLIAGTDCVVELGRSTYDAQNVAEPGTNAPGSYEHVGLTHVIGTSKLAFDLYRNDPRYATAILPYGIAENVWAVAWSWPGQWLKSNYQLIQNAPVNINRQGYRIKFTSGKGPIEVRASYANFGQIAPISMTNALQTGFVDGFFLPQQDAAATLGRQRQYALWATWHAPFADVVVDYTEDTMHRSAFPSAPHDLVSYDTPQWSMYASRKIAPSALVSIGMARYGMVGSFGQPYTNIDFGQRTFFAGAQFAEGNGHATLVSVRRGVFGGIPSQLGAPSSDFTNTQLVVEQRLTR